MILHQIIEDKVDRMIAEIYARREEFVRVWVAETGLHPSESVMVQQQKDGELRIWIRKKTEAELALDKRDGQKRVALTRDELEAAMWNCGDGGFYNQLSERSIERELNRLFGEEKP